MGRGRQKAKQTKVARELKYYSPHTDYQALERELTAAATSPSSANADYEYAEQDVDEDERSSS